MPTKKKDESKEPSTKLCTLEKKTTIENFRADVIRGPVSNVDKEKHVIKGYSVISTGELRGHDLEADQKTLEQVVEIANSHPKGIKSRFGHPNMSQTAFGTYLGRSKNFRLDGDRVRADLEIADEAFISPNGDLGTYVLSMAVNEPDMFGASIVVKARREFRIDTDGTPLKDNDGNELPPLLRVEELLGSDIVDEPATGDEMFSFFSDTVKPSAEISAFMDEFLKQENAEEKVMSFLNRYVSNIETRNKFINKLSKAVNMPDVQKKQELSSTANKFQLGEEANVPEDKTKLEEARLKEIEEARAKAKEDARFEERTRINEILLSCKSLRVDESFANQLIKDNTSLEDARKLIIDKAAENLKSVDTTVNVTVDGSDKFRDGAVKALMVRGGVEKDPKVLNEVYKSELSGISFHKLGAACLKTDGVTNAFMLSPEALFNEMFKYGYFSEKIAFGTGITQGTGDFVNVLSNTLNKSAGKGWQTANSTFERWVGTSIAKDFKKFDINRLTEYGDVERVYEGGAPKMNKFSDSKEQGQLETWGSQFILSRQAFINDDLALFTKTAASLARSMRRKMNKLAYGKIYDNNGLTAAFAGPTMVEDSAAMFNATAESTAGGHNNLVAAGSGGAPSQTTLDTAYQAFLTKRAQKPDDNSAAIYLNILPSYILVGPKYQLATYKLFNNIGYNVSGEDSAAEGTVAANIHGPGQPRNLSIVMDAEIDQLNATRAPWYLMASPMDVDTVILYTLNGQTTPFTDSAPTAIGNARGMHFVIEHDFSFEVGDWRGAYCNSGALK